MGASVTNSSCNTSELKELRGGEALPASFVAVI